jgi:hypothetical protein
MVVRAVRLFAFLYLAACMHLIVQWVVLLLLPTMRKLASVLVLASISIGLDEVLGLPLRALLLLIVKDMRFSSEVLPVVGIDTGISGVVSIAVRTPDGLEMKHIEICILYELI